MSRIFYVPPVRPVFVSRNISRSFVWLCILGWQLSEYISGGHEVKCQGHRAQYTCPNSKISWTECQFSIKLGTWLYLKEPIKQYNFRVMRSKFEVIGFKIYMQKKQNLKNWMSAFNQTWNLNYLRGRTMYPLCKTSLLYYTQKISKKINGQFQLNLIPTWMNLSEQMKHEVKGQGHSTFSICKNSLLF